MQLLFQVILSAEVLRNLSIKLRFKSISEDQLCGLYL